MLESLKKLAKPIALIVAIVSWIEFLLKPVFFWAVNPGRSQGEILQELLKFRNSIYDVPVLSYLFLASLPFAALTVAVLTAALLRALIRYLDNSEVGISVIHTKIHVELSGPNLEKAIVTRDQLFHANQAHTSAYHLEYGPSSATGVLHDDPLEFQSSIRKTKITEDIITDVEGRGHKIIETYDRELPVSVLATYLPGKWVHFLYKNDIFFHGVIVKRRIRVRYDNEYIGENRKVQVKAPLYPGSAVVIEVSFPDHQAPPQSDLSCFRIMNNRVEKVPVERTSDNGRTVYSTEVRNLFKETLRLAW